MSNVFRFFRALRTYSAHGHLNVALAARRFSFSTTIGCTKLHPKIFTEKQHFDAKKNAIHCALETETSKQRGSCRSVGAPETIHVQWTQNQRQSCRKVHVNNNKSSVCSKTKCKKTPRRVKSHSLSKRRCEDYIIP